MARSTKFTKKNIEFLRENSKNMSAGELAEFFDVSKDTIKKVCEEHNFEIKKLKVRLDEEECEFIRNNYGRLAISEIAKQLDKRYSTIKSFVDREHLDDKLANVDEIEEIDVVDEIDEIDVEETIEECNIDIDIELQAKNNADELIDELTSKYNFNTNFDILPLCDMKIELCNKLLDNEIIDIIAKSENSKLKEIGIGLHKLMDSRKSLVETMKQKLGDEIVKVVNASEYEKVQEIINDLKNIDKVII